ncbi:MAG: TolC family protein [Bryobacteraceae bacterium]|nr:TolC family protein [Bryobacteraceae bacterium]
MRYAAIALTWMAAAAAQQPAAPVAADLSLEQAIRIALAPDGAARAELAAEAVRLAEARRAQSRSALLPNLEAYTEYRDQTVNLEAFGINFSAIPIPGLRSNAISGPFPVFDARLTARQSLFDFSSIRRFQSARAAARASEAEREAARTQTADQVARAYAAALRAEAAVDTARANMGLAEAILKQARSVKEAGTGTGIEVTRAQVQLANNRQRLIVAENELTRARLSLLRAMGANLNLEPRLTDRMEYERVEPSPIREALDTARARRSELRAQRGREDAARLSHQAANAERLPSAGAFGNYGTIGRGIHDNRPTYTVGVSVRVPIFNGGATEARRAETASALRQERIRTHDLEEQIEFEVRTALDSLESADAQVAAAREGVDLAQNELAQAQRRYEAGVANSLEVTDAQTRLERARDNQIAALYSYNLARIALATATGAAIR